MFSHFTIALGQLTKTLNVKDFSAIDEGLNLTNPHDLLLYKANYLICTIKKCDQVI